MFEKGKLTPDMEILDAAGDTHRLWDFRNRTHVVVVADKDKSAVDRQLALAAEMRKTWDWLGVRFFSAAQPSPIDPGLYAVDRFGMFIVCLPFTADVWEKLEKEFIYHDAKHC
jgi:hypothetical protein